jgi:hypothetical protein
MIRVDCRISDTLSARIADDVRRRGEGHDQWILLKQARNLTL